MTSPKTITHRSRLLILLPEGELLTDTDFYRYDKGEHSEGRHLRPLSTEFTEVGNLSNGERFYRLIDPTAATYITSLQEQLKTLTDTCNWAEEHDVA